MRIVHGTICLLLGAAAAPPVCAQGVDIPGRVGAPAMTASRLESSISVDGILTEAAWQEADPVTEFVQFEPVEGSAATQQTEVRVLYGATSLFVGALLHDTEPGEIETTLGRRDDYNRADWFLVSIDSYFNRKNAYTFGVNAAGVQFDALRTGGDGDGPGGGGGGDNAPPGMDVSWDAIWYSAARVTPDGWSIEMRIPYSMLRFPEAASQTWGIHFTRWIPRLGEQTEWPLVPRTERTNLIAQFGRLTGITGIEPQRNVQIRPYVMARAQTGENLEEPNRTALIRGQSGVEMGGDVKVGLGPNVTLDATINPDFGQVESDPAVLNLTAFETFLEERRPFFVEGSQIYNFAVGPGQMLYTRRIGANAPIIGAAKVSGRTARGLSFGLLGATTGDDFEPDRQYGVARLSQQLRAYSSAGAIVTAFNGPGLVGAGHRQSLAGGLDWDLRFLGNRYGIEGFAAFTHRNGVRPSGPETGVAGKVWLRRRQGAVKGFVGLDIFGDTFNPGDIGQLDENNFVALLNSIEYDINEGKPFGPFLRAHVNSFGLQQFSYDGGLNLGQSLDVSTEWLLRSFNQIAVTVGLVNPVGGYDLYETRGLGPWARPAAMLFDLELQSDGRRNWWVEPEGGVSVFAEGGRGYRAGLRANWNIGTRFMLEGDMDGIWEDDVVAWSSNETFLRTGSGWRIGATSGPPESVEDHIAFDDRRLLHAILADVTPVDTDRWFVPVFGTRDTRSLDFILRSTVTFTPALSFQLYGQLFLARGQYGRFRILQTRDDLASFDAFPKRNAFAFSSLQTNAVLRWEYRPGSTLFVVWTHGRRADAALNPLAPWGPSPYDRPIGGQIEDAFSVFPDNVFLAKLNYTFL